MVLPTLTHSGKSMARVVCAGVQGGGGWPSWNWEEFSVSYPSLSNQLCIGGVYVRLLLEGGDASGWSSGGQTAMEAPWFGSLIVTAVSAAA